MVIGGVPIPEAMLWCGLHSFVSIWWLGPPFALLTTFTGPCNRAVALALQTLLSTLLGVGVGPVLTGLLSDFLQPAFGNEALRHALLLSCCTAGAAIVLLDRLRRHLNRGGRAATAADADTRSVGAPSAEHRTADAAQPLVRSTVPQAFGFASTCSAKCSSIVAPRLMS